MASPDDRPTQPDELGPVLPAPDPMMLAIANLGERFAAIEGVVEGLRIAVGDLATEVAAMHEADRPDNFARRVRRSLTPVGGVPPPPHNQD